MSASDLAYLALVHTGCLCVDVRLGEDGRFLCPAVSNLISIDIITPVFESPRTIWMNGNYLNEDKYILWQNLSAVTVRNMEVHDEGEYVCRVTDLNSAVTQMLTIMDVYSKNIMCR